MYVCMYVCMFVYICIHMYVYMRVCVWGCPQVGEEVSVLQSTEAGSHHKLAQTWTSHCDGDPILLTLRLKMTSRNVSVTLQ